MALKMPKRAALEVAKLKKEKAAKAAELEKQNKEIPGKFVLLKGLVDLIDKAEKDGEYMAAVTGTIWMLEHLHPDTFGDKKTDPC